MLSLSFLSIMSQCDATPLDDAGNRRTALGDAYREGFQLWELCCDSLHNASCHVLQQFRRHGHLLRHYIIYLRIVHGILQSIALGSRPHIQNATEIHDKQIPSGLLSFQNAMKGMELHPFQFQNSCPVHHHAYLKNLSTAFTDSGRANTATLSYAWICVSPTAIIASLPLIRPPMMAF